MKRYDECAVTEAVLHTYEVRRVSGNMQYSVATLHGMEDHWQVWQSLANHVDARLGLFALDLPWSGQHGQLWGLQHSARDWVKLGLGLVKTDVSVLLAHSFGANAVLDYLSTYGTSSVKAVVLISPFYKHKHEDFDWPLMIHYIDRFQQLLEEGLKVRYKKNWYAPEVVSGMAEKVRNRIGPYGWLEFFTLFSRTPELNLQSIHIPCLVLGGEHDFAAFPADCEALARALPYGRVEILEGCGHFSMLERPAAVFFRVNDFLQEALAL